MEKVFEKNFENTLRKRFSGRILHPTVGRIAPLSAARTACAWLIYNKKVENCRKEPIGAALSDAVVNPILKEKTAFFCKFSAKKAKFSANPCASKNF
jgi:hypothetical protein